MSSLYSIWISNVHPWCKAWWSQSQSMTNDSIYPHLSTKSIPGWLCSHWRRLWVWLRLEGVQLTWLGPLFPSKRLKERGGGNQCASGAVASHGSSSLCSHSCLSFPWLCLNTLCVSGQGSLCHSSLTFLLHGSHVTWICIWRSLQAPHFLDSLFFEVKTNQEWK